MQTYRVTLEARPSKSYHCRRAAQSVDLDVQNKLTHRLVVKADLETPYSIGLIVGNSGSGKTTFAQSVFGRNCFEVSDLNYSRPIIEQLPSAMKYEGRAQLLAGIGLTSIPCWIKPLGLLSNGQRARAEAAFLMATRDAPVIDEWTSVVDRSVAKVMSHCVQKFARKFEKRIILLSCHYDIVEWLNPCWIIDLNEQKYIDRRHLWRSHGRPEQEKLKFEVRTASRASWSSFSKYHYLSQNLPAGFVFFFGLFFEGRQIGFQCFAEYVPYKKGTKRKLHSNRLVIHPDFQGLGLGIRLANLTAEIMRRRGYRVFAKFSHVAMHKARKKDSNWRWLGVSNNVPARRLDTKKQMSKGILHLKSGYRQLVRTYSYEYVGRRRAG